MKKRIFIVAGIIILLGVAIFFLLRSILSEDKNRISRQVVVESYETTFLKAVQARIGKTYAQLSEGEKVGVLTTMLKDDNFVNRVVAIRYLSLLPNKGAAIGNIIPMLQDDNLEVAEEAIFALKHIGDARALMPLKELVKRTAEKPDASIPLSEIKTVSVVGTKDGDDIVFHVNELQRDSVLLNDSLVYEINLLVPKGYNYYFYFPNFDNNWEKFADSKFVSKLVELDAYKDLQTLSWTRDFFQYKALIDEQIGSFSGYFTPDRLFRDDFKIVKYEDGYLFITFKGRNIEVATALIDIARKLGASKYEVSEEQIQGNVLTSIKVISTNRTLSYATVGDYFLFSNSRSLIEKSLDTFFKRNSESITYDPLFQAAYKTVDHHGERCFLFGYFNPVKFFGIKGESRSSAYIQKIALQAMSSIAGHEVTTKNLATVTGTQHPVPTAQPTSSATELLKFITKDAIAFGVSQDAELHRYWDYILKVRSIKPEALTAIERAAKTKIERDIVNCFGNHFFVSYNGIHYSTAEGSPNFSALKLVLGINLTRKQNLETNLTKLFNYLFRSSVKSEEYNGYAIYSSGATSYSQTGGANVVENPIAPSFAVVDNNLLLGMNRTLIRQAIDVHRGSQPSVLERAAIEQSSTTQVFLFTKPFLDDAFRFLRLYSTRSGTFSDLDVEQKVKPFFDVLEMNKQLTASFSELQHRLSGMVKVEMKY